MGISVFQLLYYWDNDYKLIRIFFKIFIKKNNLQKSHKSGKMNPLDSLVFKFSSHTT